GLKMLRVVRQHLLRRERLRIEAPLPLGIVVAGRADPDIHSQRLTQSRTTEARKHGEIYLGFVPSWLVERKVATVYGMTLLLRTVVVVAMLASGCSRTPPAKEYQLQGQILDVKPETNEVLVKHGDIPGFMPAMT